MVLAGDDHGASGQVHGGLVGAAVAELELLGLSAGGQCHHLVSQADAEHGDLAKELLDLLDAERIVGRVARAVGQHHAVVSGGKNFFCGGVIGINGHFAASGCQGVGDAALCAVVQQGHRELFFALGGNVIRLFGAGVLHGLLHPIGLEDLQVGLCLLCGDDGVHHAAVPDHLGQHPGVDPGDAHHVLLLQKGVHRGVTAEVGGLLTVFPDDYAAHLAVGAFHVLATDAVVAELREGVYHQLTIVAGVGQAFHAPGHTGGEDQLADGGAGGAETLPLQDLAVC